MKLNNCSIVRASHLYATKFIFLVVVLVFFTASLAQASWQINWEAGAFLEYTDNVQRDDSGGDSDIVLEPFGDIEAIHLGPRVDVHASAHNEYRGYSDNTIGNRNDFSLDGSVDWKISPNLFHWIVEDHFSTEFPIDVRDSPNQSNQQNINTFVTGPTFTPQIFNNTFLDLEGRYIRSDSEESDIDNDRYQGKIGIRRSLSALSEVSLNYQYEDVDFDDDADEDTVGTVTFNPITGNFINNDDGNIDYTRNDYYAVYSTTRRSLSLSGQIGYTKINREYGPNKSSEGNNSSVTADYTINSTSNISLTAFDQYRDLTTDNISDRGFGLGGGFGGIGGFPGGIDGNNDQFADIEQNVTGDTAETKGISLQYSKSFTRLSSIFRVFTEEEEYDIVTFNDREIDGVSVELSLPYGTSTEYNFNTTYRETEFDFDGREDDDLYIALSSQYLFNRNWRFETNINYRERNSDFNDDEFDAYEIRIGAVYANF